MERQTVIDMIEKVISSIANLNGFVNIFNDFTAHPRSKKEIRDFCEQYVLDVFLSAGDLKTTYTQMTIEPTRLNCIELVYRIANHPTLQTEALLKTVKSNMDACIDSILLLVSESVESLDKDNTPELGYKITQINQALCLMRNIFTTVRDVPITKETFPAFQQTYEKDDYLHCQFDEIVRETQKHFKTLSASN